MLPTDARGEWDDHLLNDPRVVHLWDGERITGRWFGWGSGRPAGSSGTPTSSSTGARPGTTRPRSWWWGRTVIGRSDDLKQQIAPLLG